MVRARAAAAAVAEGNAAVSDGLTVALALLAHALALGFAFVRHALRVEGRLARLEALAEVMARSLGNKAGGSVSRPPA